MKYLFYYLIIINVVAFALMLIDKNKAKRRQYRIPEATLIGSAILGGSIGAWLGMYSVRHKTKHLKFTLGIPLIFLAQAVLAVLVLYLRKH